MQTDDIDDEFTRPHPSTNSSPTSTVLNQAKSVILQERPREFFLFVVLLLLFCSPFWSSLPTGRKHLKAQWWGLVGVRWCFFFFEGVEEFFLDWWGSCSQVLTRRSQKRLRENCVTCLVCGGVVLCGVGGRNRTQSPRITRSRRSETEIRGAASVAAPRRRRRRRLWESPPPTPSGNVALFFFWDLDRAPISVRDRNRLAVVRTDKASHSAETSKNGGCTGYLHRRRVLSYRRSSCGRHGARISRPARSSATQQHDKTWSTWGSCHQIKWWLVNVESTKKGVNTKSRKRTQQRWTPSSSLGAQRAFTQNSNLPIAKWGENKEFNQIEGVGARVSCVSRVCCAGDSTRTD